MTEFQTATLALQEAAWAAQHAAHGQALWIGVGQILASVAGGGVSAVLILRGLRRMREAAVERSEELKQESRRTDQRHAETLAAFDVQRRALEILIERTTPREGGSHAGA